MMPPFLPSRSSNKERAGTSFGKTRSIICVVARLDYNNANTDRDDQEARSETRSKKEGDVVRERSDRNHRDVN
jgi:hypothetical protein